MRLLVLGANGLLGSNVVHVGQRRGWDVSGTYHSTAPAFDIPLTRFDLEEAESFSEILADHELDVVVNCAAMTDVDGCETNPESAHAINGDAPGYIAASCEARDVEFVHISTDYVFDGSGRDGYSESVTPNPVQVYGESKLAGERAVETENASALIARLSFVWGVHRSSGALTGFPDWVRGRLQSGQDVPLFTNQRVTPTRASQAAETVLDLLEHDVSGLFHVACTSCVTPYEFGAAIADSIGANESLLAEGSMDDVERAATRPRNTCLSVERVENVLGRAQPTLRQDIEAVGAPLR